ncbi:hypothetical protein BDR22DRAFT_978112 [Usnea florida]
MSQPVRAELTGFHAKIKYQDMTADTNTVLQFLEKQETSSNFNEYMLHRRKDQATCLDVYPIEKETQGQMPRCLSILAAVCAESKLNFQRVPGYVILQDHSGSIKTALSTPGVENMFHNMFKPQPITGLVSYLSQPASDIPAPHPPSIIKQRRQTPRRKNPTYLRAVIHNRPDHKRREIPENIIPAMGPEFIQFCSRKWFPARHRHGTCTGSRPDNDGDSRV